MARLIPRKQIEEQQNISSSLNIGQDVNVGNDAIISGSLFVSQSFFLGNDTGSRSEITSSVFFTGSLEIDGQLIFKGPEAILSATSSNSLLAVDTQRYAGILAKDFGANLPTLYVSSTDGDDTNDGRSIQYPLRTIKRAAALATPGYDGRYGFDTGSIYNGYVIKVQAGTYLEDNPVILPKNTTIWGAGLRITKINAKNPTEDLFWVNSGCYIAEVTMGGLRLYPNQINPEKGFGVAFQPGAFITTSPYVQNCSQISNQENSFTELYEDIPPGGGGLYVNGDVIDPDSPLASMVLDAYTQISPNGVGCLVNGRGFIQLVSFFNNFSYYAIRVNNGGHATLNNSNISFGLYGMYASGSRFISGSGGNTSARDSVRASWSVIVDVLNRGLDALPEVTTLNTNEGIRLSSPSVYPQYTTSSGVELSTNAADEISSDFKLVSAIVENGNSNFPTLLARSSNKGFSADSPYNILGAEQITGSLSGSTTPLSASLEDLSQISSSFGVILGIFANGTGSYDFKSSASASISRTSFTPQPSSPSLSNDITASISSSFETIISIIKNGLSAVPAVTSSTSASLYIGNIEPTRTGLSSSLSVINKVSSSFSIIYNVLSNGTGSNILPIPNDHITNYTITNNNSSSYQWQGVGSNPTITLFRGETYKFYVSASEALGGINYPFFIRTQPIETIANTYDYNKGVVNNGDSVGNITFTVPYDAPNTLYYTSQTNNTLSGRFNIVNNSATQRELIANTLTYPATISGSVASEDTDIINAFEILTGSKAFIQEEVIQYISSSWSGVDGFTYVEETCRRDVGFLVDAVCQDLLYGGNDKSITAGRFYYEYPSTATTTQKEPTKTAVKYAAKLAQQLLKNIEFRSITLNAYTQKRFDAWAVVNNNKSFVQNETIAFLSSSWSNFNYNETKCKRDVGYIIDAVATDILYGGNERAIEAGEFYYLYPSNATVPGDGDSVGQLGQTLDGIRFAAGMMNNLIAGKTFSLPTTSSQAAYSLIRDNKSLIQNEVIQYINVAYPQLKYNTDKCRRDVGYILDAVATDLIYGGNERSVTAGKYYYDYPSVATSIQKRETSGAIRYAKIITDYIVKNTILDTPRIVNNDERNIKVTNFTNVTSSFSGTITQQNSISSSFAIMEGIIKRGLSAIPSILAQNTGLNWGKDNPLNVTSGSQITSSFVTPTEVNKIGSGFDIVNTIIAGGIAAEPVFTSSQTNAIKVTSIAQYSGSNAASGSVSSSLSASISLVGTIVTNGTGSIPTFTSSVQNNIKVTATSIETLAVSATTAESQSISSSMKLITDVLVGGKSVLPALTSSLSQNIKVTSAEQYISSSYSGSLEDVAFISSSISIVTKIIERGESAGVFGKANYTSSLSSSNALAAYNIIKQNIDLIQDETIAYLSSSWSSFQYDEAKCRRDVGLIISGAAEDLIWNQNSASVVNGQFYYEYPSQATGSQLAQTLDGINYASRLTQKLIQNIQLQQFTGSRASASLLILNNKDFIADETIAYMSSSWGSFDYNETTCRRDIGYILDAIRTDITYGGNERTRIAADYYFTYPSAATGSQLIQTTDAINYASRIAQKVVVGETFTQALLNSVNASELIRRNKELIAAEVVEYVSSSWSGVLYNEDKCKRDVGYILDAVRTDLVYGGNERSIVAGDFYYRYPSSATVGGVPSSTQQLDPTITGVYYANQLVQNIIKNVVLTNPSAAVLSARELVRENRAFIQQNTIDYVNDTYPTLNYKEDKCYRDTGFIIDNVLTDLVYGGNERAITAGRFYYLYPSQATDAQVTETVDAIEFARDLAELVAIGGNPIEDGFDIVSEIIASGSSIAPTLVSNTEDGIRKSSELQFLVENEVNSLDKTIVSSSFANVINIVDNGVSSIPTIIPTTNRGVNRIGGSQFTSSIIVDSSDRNVLSSSFDIILDIVENGTGSIPTITTNASGTTKITSFSPTTGTTISSSLINSTTSSFDIVLDIVENGTGSMVSLVTNANSLVKVTGGTQYTTGTDASSKAGLVTSSFDTILDIIENGTSVIPTLVENTTANIRIGSAPTSGTAATSTEANTIGSLIDIVTNIVENGTGSMATLIPYTAVSTDVNVLNAYANLKANITFIQNETIAYLSSSWSTASYDETKCKRDVGLIVSGAAEDLLFNANSASLMNGKFYYLYPSQAETTQLNQTLDGINYAKRLAKKIVVNTTFTQPTAAATATKDLLINNKSLIADEVVAYISSSWTIGDNTSDPYFYNEATCKRDVGYILDAVATDIVYGGNERTSKAGEFYYLYPSQATGYQLDQTLDGVRYAKNVAEQIVKGNTLVSVSQQKLDARTLIDNNRTFISEEVVAYVSSSWREHDYNEAKCKRDVGYILDAVKTDLVYGGNERSRQAGEYYYKYPSNATGAELAPTLTGVKYAKGLVLEVLANSTFQTASLSKQTAYDLLVDNKLWIQNQTIAKINANLDTITYNEATCKRDVGYIVDAVATDILYGGNERSAEAGEYYFLFPSAATGSQLAQTLEGIGYAKSLSNSVIANELVYTQTTSSVTPSTTDINKVGSGFDIVMDIIANGTGSIPSIFTNASSSIKRTDSVQYITTASISSTYLTNSNSAFDVVLDVVENGTGSLPSLVRNVNALVKLTNSTQYSSSMNVSSSLVNGITSSFNKVINILENGTGSLPNIISNTFYNTKVTNTPQYISGSSATSTEATLISQSISIVTNVIANGTGSTLNTLALSTSSYVTAVSDDNKWIAYGILKNNIAFIQDETIAYLSSSWSTASYDEAKCRRDIGLIVSGAAEDLVFNSNSASVVSAKYYYEYPSQAQGAQLNQTLDGVFYASKLVQKVITNTLFTLPNTQTNTAYDLLINNKEFIQNETIAYISSSWSTKQYNETTCKRDVGYILDAIATDTKWGGNERTITAGVFYYLYPSAATGSQLKETVTGVTYAKNLADKLLRNAQFQKVSQNKLQAKDLIVSNKNFIANEVIAYVSASWSGFQYNEDTCKRDVGYILDAVATDIVYGGNERSYEAGRYYYYEPSTATTTQLGPTLSGIGHAKGVTQQILKNSLFVTASNSAQAAYELLIDNKDLIQTETIGFLNSAWSFFEYNEAKCRRDVGYIVDAVATDILYGGNESSARAGEYYYLYPSLATVEGDGNESGQLDQTLDGVKYAKGIAQKIAENILLKNPTKSEIAGWDLLNKNKTLIQKETIAFLSSSWSGIGGFSYNEVSCSRDVAYIVDNVATDLVYGGNERSSKAGEYYYLYPSAATVTGSISPTTTSQKGPTIDGIQFAAGVAQNILSKKILIEPTEYVQSAYSLMKQNRTFIQNETIQFIDAFYPYLRYNREKCRRDVGYIVDNVATDLWYGGNQRSIIAGDYYYRYPSKATKVDQVVETVAGVEYAKALTKKIVQNIQLSQPTSTSNTTANIKVGSINQYTSSISATSSEINKVSSSFSIVTEVIEGGLTKLPTIVSNNDGLIKISNETIVSSSVSASSVEVGIVTASFGLIRDIIYWGSASVPDSLANNYNYGFELSVPKLLHISSVTQSLESGVYNSQTSSVSSSFGNVINIINNGTGSIPSLVANTSGSVKTTGATLVSITGSSSEVNRIGNLFGVILNIVENGKSVIPTLVPNTSASIKVTSTPQIISGSGADRLQAKLISSSFSYVIDMLSYGTSSVTYEAPSLTPNTNAKVNSAYNLLLDNKQMIVDETIAFMSSSWSTFVYNEASCSRDVALIVSGAAYDLLYGGNSASFVNGKFYFEYPSAATGSQLDQTITALKFASGLAEKVVKNEVLTHFSSSFISSSWASLRTNKQFIQSESIAYLSSSWQGFDYNETTCKRDIGYIIDAVATDILYGGNERSIIAGRYYYDYPSQATTAQLEPTLTGVRYAKGLAMNIVSGSTFVSPSVNTQTAYNLIKNNKTFIQEETVAFVNAKYPELDYIESKCRRDVGYIVDAVATDLLYGGNERSNKAGEFYYLYPSLATESEQVVETTTAVDYARRLTQEIINSNLIAEPQIVLNTANNIKVTAQTQYTSSIVSNDYDVNVISSSVALVSGIIENGLDYIPNRVLNTTQSIKVTNATQNQLVSAGTLDEVGFITASVKLINDIIYTGGNVDYALAANFNQYGLSSTNPIHLSTQIQITSASAWNTTYEKNLVSSSFGNVINIIQNGTGSIPTLINNASSSFATITTGIYSSSISGSIVEGNIVTSSFDIVADIIENENYPTLVTNASGRIKTTNATIVSQSVSASASEIINVSSSFANILNILVNGTSVISSISSNTDNLIKVTSTSQYVSASGATLVEANSIINSIDVVTNIIENGLGVVPTLVKNTNSNIKVTNTTLVGGTSATVAESSSISSSISDIVNVIVNGTGSLQPLVSNTNGNIKVTSTSQYLSSSFGTSYEASLISSSISIVTNIVANGLGVAGTPTNYSTPSTASNVYYAYNLVKENLGFIQDETIAYLSSSWSTASYDEAKCRRDVGLIISGALEDVLFGVASASIVNGKFYFESASQATGAQLNQTLDGLFYASKLAQKIAVNTTFVTASANKTNAANLIKNNKSFIQNETIAYLSSSWGEFNYNDVTCKRDIGYILDASVTDLVYGGNERSREAGRYYFLYPSQATGSQLVQTVDGINYASTLAQKIVIGQTFTQASSDKVLASELIKLNKNFIANETIAYISSSWSIHSYDEAKCARDTKYILDAVRTDLVYGGNERSKVAGEFYYLYPSAATGSQLDETLDGINYAKGLAYNVVLNNIFVSPSSNVSGSYNLLFENKQFIQSQSIAYISSSWTVDDNSTGSFYYNEEKCKRDVGYIIDAVATDLRYGGNQRSSKAGEYYYLYPSQATGSQLNQTVEAIKYVAGLSNELIQNKTFQTASSEISASYVLLRNNKDFISNEVISYVSSSWSEHDYNEAKCRRDVGYIIDAVSTDLLYGGNERSTLAGDYYFRFPSNATTSELAPTLSGIRYAKHLAEKIVKGGISFSNGINTNDYVRGLLLANKEFIKSEVIAFVNAKFPNNYYSETKCSRDTGYIIDAVATDLRYGGNERANEAGRYYYLFPSEATTTQSEETTAGIKYAASVVASILNNSVIGGLVQTSNVSASIKATNTPQYITSSNVGTTYEASLISSSISIVANIVENGIGVAGTPVNYSTPSTASNVWYAYNLLKQNLEFIKDETIAYISSSWSTASYDESKCKRDVGLIISGAAEDMLFGVDSASIVNGKFYFESASQATGTQLNFTLDGINYASRIAQKIVENVTFVSPSTNVSASVALLRNNKTFIQSESIAYLSSSWASHSYNETTCKRDIGYIIDAVSTDLWYGGNERSVIAGEYYFKYPSNATGSELEPTVTGIKYAGDVAAKIAQNITFVTASESRQNAWALLRNNKNFIAEETIAYISSSWVIGSYSDNTFVYNEAKCKRDVGYILDAVATDVLYGGNDRSIEAGRFYFLYPSQATGSQLDETLEGVRYAGQLAQKVVTNTLFVTASAFASASHNLMKQNKSFIQAETIAYVSSSWVGFDYSEAKCRRDVGYLVDAVATDILYGGNQRSATAGIYYFKYPSTATNAQLEPTVNAIDFAGGVAKNIINGVTFVTASQIVSASVELLRNNRNFIQEETMQYLTASWSNFDYNKEKCRRDVGYIVDGVATDLLYGGNERTVMSGEFYFKYPNKATLLGDGDGVGQLKQTVDGINYASRIAQKVIQNTIFVQPSQQVSASFDLLRKNKSFVAAETIAYVSSSWSGVRYNEASCSRDVNYLIDAAATDLLYGGQERSITAGTFYYLFPSNATNAGVPSEQNQLDPTITGVRYAGKLASKSVTNPTYVDAWTVSGSLMRTAELLTFNKSVIQKETITFLSSSWATLKYNEVSCSRDLGFIIDAIRTDLVYGGNERSIEAGSYYYRIPSVAIAESYTDNGEVGQKKQTVDGINFARGIAEKVVANTQLTYLAPSLKRRQAAERLLSAKDELKQRAIGYTNGAFPYLVYNEASCSRDTGLIVDACVTDLLYGGNERAIAAASSYWNAQYGSAQAVVSSQKLETLETNRYLRTRAEFIAAGAPLESFGSLIVATGIDYSYNGSGVTFKALPPNQGGSGAANPLYEITELGGGRIFFTSGNQDGDFRIGTGLSINQATGTLVGRTFSKSLFSLVTPFSLALQI